MSELNIQQIMGSRFRTSGIAERFTVKLMENLGLSTKANVARLAIGRSLGLGPFNDQVIDAKGYEIPASSLFSQDDVPIWVGLIITHAKLHNKSPIDTMDAFRVAIRQHWHRGAHLLMEDWKTCDEDYDKFIETLVNRRAELPDSVVASKNMSQLSTQDEKACDISLQLVRALADIGVNAEVRGLLHGPRISRYNVFLPDINLFDRLRKGLERISLILNLQQSIPTLSPGNEPKTIHLDIPRPKNSWKSTGISDLKQWAENTNQDVNKLLVFPGVDVMGNPYSFDLSTAPHLLVGGATGQGKSVCLHALIVSLMLNHSPSSLRLSLIDPKQVEFSIYRNSKYLFGDGIAIDINEARECINELVAEMDSRYNTFSQLNATNIFEARQKGINLPFIVLFIEELADLVMQDRNIEGQIVRLAQLARAAGIHLVLATQRPDAKTFSGLIRSNIPARIALTVQKHSESNIILDEAGAENLLGAGDMLIKKPGDQLKRVHGVYITRKDLEHFLRN